jgi:hypothetical protein
VTFLSTLGGVLDIVGRILGHLTHFPRRCLHVFLSSDDLTRLRSDEHGRQGYQPYSRQNDFEQSHRVLKLYRR